MKLYLLNDNSGDTTFNELSLGDILPNGAKVLALTKVGKREIGETYASWITVCHRDNAYHPYVVWTVIARPEGFSPCSGDYTFDMAEALKRYKLRGGQ